MAVPLWSLFRFVFYKVIVKLYKFYFSFIKKLGWTGFKDSPVLFLLKQKAVHVGVVVLTMTLIFVNLTTKAKAGVAVDQTNQTILSSLVTSELDSPEGAQLIEESFDAEANISPTQQSYLNNLSSVKNEPTSNNNSIDGMDQDKSLSEDGTAVIKPDIVSTKQTIPQRTDITEYAIQPGDTISSIAENFGISINTILWENNLTVYSTIKPGDKLTILPVSGVTYQVARGESLVGIAGKYKVDLGTILEINKLSDAGKLTQGQKLIIPGGRKITSYASNGNGTADRSADASDYSGLKMIKDLIVKPPSLKPVAGGKMAWPTVGYRITQYYTWRHHAIDIANKVGTPIYAADSGVIETAGWGTGYGNQIVINHDDGKKTRYGHMSKFYVQKGDTVEKGQVIGAMGSTGWSTGPHVHFEVIIDGIKYNPLNYLR